ncbi:hypothetical protein D8674_037136 [Pyrus ussuriensis x Pyrus communis]|uniref:Uncharacterized protein n=1 Tax=Pyrus ussuriensis x Pyrus communis TaxID=2448454 RepID=A0A5N5FNW1_9ROSA|nr:hypothetical protein D8674_037136 [Pyrus ussuriensis x Pyrus communis]
MVLYVDHLVSFAMGSPLASRGSSFQHQFFSSLKVRSSTICPHGWIAGQEIITQGNLIYAIVPSKAWIINLLKVDFPEDDYPLSQACEKMLPSDPLSIKSRPTMASEIYNLMMRVSSRGRWAIFGVMIKITGIFGWSLSRATFFLLYALWKRSCFPPIRLTRGADLLPEYRAKC